MTGIRVRPRLAKRIRARCRGQVPILADDRHAGGLVHPCLAGIQQVVGVHVATHERRTEIVQGIARGAVVVP